MCADIYFGVIILELGTLTQFFKADLSDFNRGLSEYERGMARAESRGREHGKAIGLSERSMKGFNRELRDAGRQAERTTGYIGELTRKILGLKNTDKLNLSNILGSGLSGGVLAVTGGNLAASAITTIIGGVTSAMTSGIKLGFDYRRMQEEVALGFTQILKDGKAAKDFMGQLAAFERESPMDLPGVYTGAQRLLAMGFNAKQVIPILRAAGDAAAGAGKTGAEAAQKIDSITLALGQMWNKGKVSAEEMSRQLVEAGIPAWRYLADEIARTDSKLGNLTEEKRISKVQEMAEHGLLNARTAVAVILRGIDKDFGGLGKEISEKTASGIETNLGTALSRQLGTASGPAFERYKQVLGLMLQGVNSEAADRLVGGVSTGTSRLFDSMENTVKAVMSGDINALGLNVAAGLAQGINEGTKGVMGAAANMGHDAITATADAIGARSPAKEFIKLGLFAAEGFYLGLQEGMRKPFPPEIEKLILENAKRTGLSADLIRAVIMQESRGRVDAVSPKGAKGLMQLMDGTARRYSVNDPFDPAQNIEGGTRYLADLLDKFAGDVRLALAAYNAGEGAVEKYHGIPPYKETQKYIQSIMASLSRTQSDNLVPVSVMPSSDTERHAPPSKFPPAWQIVPEEAVGTSGITDDLFSLFEGVQSGELQGRANRINKQKSTKDALVLTADDIRLMEDFFQRRIGAEEAYNLTVEKKTELAEEYLAYLKEELRVREAIAASQRIVASIPTVDYIPDIDFSKINPSFDALKRAHSEIIDTERSANELSINYVPRALRALQLPALETASAFENLPPLIKKAQDAAEMAEARTKDAVENLSKDTEGIISDSLLDLMRGKGVTAGKNFALGFLESVQRGIANSFAQKINDALFGDGDKNKGLIGGVFEKLFGNILGVKNDSSPDAVIADNTRATIENTLALRSHAGLGSLTDLLSSDSLHKKISGLQSKFLNKDGPVSTEAADLSKIAPSLTDSINETIERTGKDIEATIANQGNATNNSIHQLESTMERLLTPHEQSFLGGLLNAVISGAISGAIGSMGDGGGGSADEGPNTGRPTSPPTLKNFGGPRALGGPVEAGTLYEVNENGTEYFKPDVDGQIIPLGSPQAQQGGNTTINHINVTVPKPRGSSFNQKRGHRDLAESIAGVLSR
ncbi:MAG TPA: transglycosylase SLT domain-containing protein [Pyrinomonadaceae bacterium]